MTKESFSALFQATLDLHREALDALIPRCVVELERIAGIWTSALAGGGRILFAGNGGSASDAQHLAAELVVRFRMNRPALAGLALTTDTSVLTACANDFGFEDIFARQVEALGRPGDVLVAISTSGRSQNIVKAAEAAHKGGLKITVFCGREPGLFGRLADAILAVPSDVTAHIQECHMICGHILCEWVERNLPCP